MSIINRIQKYDAEHGIPRPMTAPHLTAYHAALHCVKTGAQMLGLICCGLVSAYLLWISANLVKAEFEVRLIFVAGMLLAMLISGAEATQLLMPYRRFKQRLTHGSAMWADTAWLKSQGFAQDYTTTLKSGDLRLGSLPTGHQLVLPADHTLKHVAIFGPPGSGKSATFICTFLRNWSKHGSTIVLDPKGELYAQTASCYEHAYRLDLMAPDHSDHWNFVPVCKNDAELAHQIASIIIGAKPAAGSTDSDAFWRDSEIAALSAILLHLPHIVRYPTPSMINEFIALRSIDAEPGQLSPLTREMFDSPDPNVARYWGAFTKAKRDLQGSILTGVIAKCQSFTTPNVQSITSANDKDSVGRGEIDLSMLRSRGTAFYVVIPEGDAERYAAFLTTFFGIGMAMLRRDKITKQTPPTLFLLDEAGNIPVYGLKEMLGVGRGRKVAMILAYQNLGQVYAHYGRDGADAVLGSINSMIFLPGLDQRTTERASERVGNTTVLQETKVDAPGTQNDAERLAETKRPLMDPAELRQLVRHKQAVAIIDTAAPIKFAYPPLIQATGKAISEPAHKGVPAVIDFRTAERQFINPPDESTPLSSSKAVTSRHSKSRSETRTQEADNTGGRDELAKNHKPRVSAVILDSAE